MLLLGISQIGSSILRMIQIKINRFNVQFVTTQQYVVVIYANTHIRTPLINHTSAKFVPNHSLKRGATKSTCSLHMQRNSHTNVLLAAMDLKGQTNCSGTNHGPTSINVLCVQKHSNIVGTIWWGICARTHTKSNQIGGLLKMGISHTIKILIISMWNGKRFKQISINDFRSPIFILNIVVNIPLIHYPFK